MNCTVGQRIGVVLFAAALQGCMTGSAGPDQGTPLLRNVGEVRGILLRQEVPPAAPHLPEAAAQLEITRMVQQRLVAEPSILAGEIDVSTLDGVVVLRGRVPTRLALERALAIAQEAPGVTRVLDQLLLTVPEIPDGILRENVEWALGLEPIMQTADVDVDAQAGVVKLDGMVGSALERLVMEQAVKGVGGVRNVVNNLRVDAPTPLEAALHAAVLHHLRETGLTEDARLRVRVDGDKVIIRGRVHDAEQIPLIATAAHRAGAPVVDVLGLRVEPPPGAGADVAVDDLFLTTVVMNALSGFPMFDLTAEVHQGHVVLHGTVPGGDLSRQVEARVGAIPGVTGVDNKIRVVR